ncbi:bifunctional 2-polyprenyl-6-hydroxyphenol methylase/3-demethylubiquinol 3-O-methyltransferase UbiG [Cellulomonas sp. B6]|uniref:class I SAM-dependent methyltransferase n=1 Tax=Cellulomonas sp. B6 TaxID=1295626 RepID=UPI00073CF582|nr:class I SAM-dependent methyltransferase [Cellulomonas sp. B6]KSW29254.1 hypothetical protein ATM99_08860 [Cellulomonas sp. B6]
MSQYEIADVDRSAVNSSQVIELELVGADREVLDIGCATGYLGSALAEQGCTVTGVEYDAEAAERAREVMSEVVVADLERSDLTELFPGRTFDVVVLGDVLEHLMHPEQVLASAVRLLAPGGSVVVSVPNVAHGSLRLALLQGRWDYRETGLLDRTHVRFFTRQGVADLLRAAGLRPVDVRAVVLDPLEVEVDVDADALPWAVVDWVRKQPDAYTYQFVLRAVPGEDDGTPFPEPVPAVPLPERDDAHTERGRIEAALHAPTVGRGDIVDEVIELRHRVLTLRDHAVGAEASVGAARNSVARAQAAERHARAELERQLAEIKSTASWRVGTKIVSPLARVKRVVRGS